MVSCFAPARTYPSSPHHCVSSLLICCGHAFLHSPLVLAFFFFFWLRALGSARHYGWLVIFRSRRELTTTSEGIERGLSSAAETHTRDRGFNFISSSQITSRRPTDVYPVAIWQYVLKPTIRPSLAVAERFSSIWRRAERHTRTNQTTPSGDVSSSLGSDGRKRRGRGRGSELVGATDDAKPGAAS
jgi:hypothetical protein